MKFTLSSDPLLLFAAGALGECFQNSQGSSDQLSWYYLTLTPFQAVEWCCNQKNCSVQQKQNELVFTLFKPPNYHLCAFQPV